MTSVVDEMLHFILLGSVDEVRWGSREVWAVHGVFLVWK